MPHWRLGQHFCLEPYGPALVCVMAHSRRYTLQFHMQKRVPGTEAKSSSRRWRAEPEQRPDLHSSPVVQTPPFAVLGASPGGSAGSGSSLITPEKRLMPSTDLVCQRWCSWKVHSLNAVLELVRGLADSCIDACGLTRTPTRSVYAGAASSGSIIAQGDDIIIVHHITTIAPPYRDNVYHDAQGI